MVFGRQLSLHLKWRTRWALPLALVALLASGCIVTPVAPAGTIPRPTATPTTVPTTPGAEETADPLANSEWRLVSMGAADSPAPVIGEDAITLSFADGQAGGHSGCNEYGGSYQVENGALVFGEIVSTLRACVDEAVMQQEQQYLGALRAAGRFERTEEGLTIRYADESGVLNFVAADAAEPSPATVTPADELTGTATLTPTTDLPAGTPDSAGEATSAQPTRITFTPGETSATVEGMIGERQTDYYVLHAQAGQIMSVEIASPNDDVLLTVVGEDGTPLKRYQAGPPSWTSQLPATQDYFIHAVSVGPATTYTLHVRVLPLASVPAEHSEFAPGATSAQISGLLPAGGGVQQYVLAASAGQTLAVEVMSDDVPVEAVITGPTGFLATAEPVGGDANHVAQTVPLAETGDYTVTLATPDRMPSTNYTVTFTIE
ncbi:MAG TPA: META domain-containing protein [Caldilineaceae bacterium]|nr:META domain-containing protein [Caldilineaceae bacterium]